MVLRNPEQFIFINIELSSMNLSKLSRLLLAAKLNYKLRNISLE